LVFSEKVAWGVETNVIKPSDLAELREKIEEVLKKQKKSFY